MDVRFRGGEGPLSGWRRRRAARGSSKAAAAAAVAPHKEGRWREKVRAPVVEHAWEMLCGSIIQQVRLQECRALRLWVSGLYARGVLLYAREQHHTAAAASGL